MIEIGEHEEGRRSSALRRERKKRNRAKHVAQKKDVRKAMRKSPRWTFDGGADAAGEWSAISMIFVGGPSSSDRTGVGNQAEAGGRRWFNRRTLGPRQALWEDRHGRSQMKPEK